MKNQQHLPVLLVLSIFLSTVNLVFGQNNEGYIFSRNMHSFLNKTLTLGDRIYSVGASATCRYPLMSKNTADKTQSWSGPAGEWYFSDLMLLPGQDSTLITCGYYHEGGDVAPFEEGPSVVAYDLEGTLLFGTLLPLLDGYQWDVNMKVTTNGAGQIVAKMGHELYWLAANGDFQMVKSYPSVDLVDIDRLNDTTLLALGKHKLYWLTNDGEKIDSLEIANEAKDLWLGHGSIYVVTTEEFIVIDSPLLTESYALSPYGISPEGVTGNSESLIFWGDDFSTPYSKIIEIQYAGFALVELVLFEKEKTEIIGVEVVEDELVISGRTGMPLDDLPFGFIKKIDLLSAPIFGDDDIVLDDFRSINSLEVRTETYSDADSTITLYYYSAFPLVYELDVTNNGLDTLRSFVLYSEAQGSFLCHESRLNSYYGGLAIPPGESLTIVDSANIVFNGTQFPGPPNLRMSVFAPNHHFEGNESDNGLDVDIMVGLNSPPLIEIFSLLLSPNPAQDFIQLNYQGEEKLKAAQIGVFDLQGKRMLELKADLKKGNTIELNTNQLPPGLYFLNVINAGKISSQKFVVQG